MLFLAEVDGYEGLGIDGIVAKGPQLSFELDFGPLGFLEPIVELFHDRIVGFEAGLVLGLEFAHDVVEQATHELVVFLRQVIEG